jgi:hypothetical protein
MSSHTAMDANATHVHQYYFRKYRFQALQLRRMQNATARRLGFRNYATWQGED